MSKIKIATVFSGIGAPEFAAQRVFKKIKNVFACEIDKFARQSYDANHKVKYFYEDITKVDFKKHKKDKIDILIGGSPCQSFSIAGKRRGLEDTRGTLFYEFARALKESKPKYFIFENVKGMVNHDKGNTMETVLRTFGELNYDITAKILNSKDHGVPQNRERIFVVGVRRKKHTKQKLEPSKGKLLADKLHNKIVELYEEGALNYYHDYEFPTPMPLEKRLKDVLEDDVDEKYYLSNKMVSYLENAERSVKPFDGSQEYANTLCAVYHKTPTDGQYVKVPQINMVGLLDCKGTDQIRRVYGTDGIAATLTTMQGGNQEPKIQVPSATKQGYETATTGDSINLSVPNSKTRRGRVGKQVAQCLDTACNQATIVGDTNEKDTTKTLSTMWERNVEKTIQQWEDGGGDRIYAEKVLHEGLCESSISFGDGQKEEALQLEPLYSENDSEIQNEYNLLLAMWDKWEDGYTSHRRELGKQQTRELDGLMQKLSHEYTQYEVNVQTESLQYKSERSRLLREALSEIQKMGESIQGEKTEKQNYRIRKLTERECFRLQDFPDDFIQVVSASQAYKQAGNSMTVRVIEELMKGLKDG